MEDFSRRFFWLFITTCLVVYAGYVFAGSWMLRKSVETPVVILDQVRPYMHSLSGMVNVQSPCDQLSVRAESISTSTYMLLFSTWREPSVTCKIEPFPRSFQTQFFAPAHGIHIYATLDGQPLPIFIEAVTATKDP